MASTIKSVAILPLSLLLIIFLAVNSPKVNAGLAINGISIAGLEIGGIAHCSSTVTSPCTTCAPIPNLLLSVRFAPIPNLLLSVRLKGNVIAAVRIARDGTFRIRLNVGNLITGLSDLDSLRVFTSVPIVGCPIWASVTTGILEGVPILDQEAGGVKIIDGNIACLLVPALNLVS